MELLQLKYFLELARNEHLTRTANELMISPPSLSLTVKKLEGELGTSLFDRSNKGFRLNENGKLFYQYISRSLSLIEEARIALNPVQQQVLRIALFSQPIYSSMLYQFEKQHPQVKLDVSRISFGILKNAVRMSEFHFFLGAVEDIDEGDYDNCRLFAPEKPVVMLSKENPLSCRTSLSLSDLADNTLFMISSENESSKYFIKKLFDENHFSPSRVCEGDYLMRTKMVMANEAAAITTNVGAAVNSIPTDSIAIVPLKNTSLTRTQSVCWPKKRSLTPIEKDFLSFCRQYFAENPLIRTKRTQ